MAELEAPNINWLYVFSEKADNEVAKQRVASLGEPWTLLGKSTEAVFIGRPLPVDLAVIAQELGNFPKQENWKVSPLPPELIES